ncbi:MAG: hypothetical protein WCT14_00445 [Treponemataceae bacterium]
MNLFAILLAGKTRWPVVVACRDVEEGLLLGSKHPSEPACIEISRPGASGDQQDELVARFRKVSIAGEPIWKKVRE